MIIILNLRKMEAKVGEDGELEQENIR